MKPYFTLDGECQECGETIRNWDGVSILCDFCKSSEQNEDDSDDCDDLTEFIGESFPEDIY